MFGAQLAGKTKQHESECSDSVHRHKRWVNIVRAVQSKRRKIKPKRKLEQHIKIEQHLRESSSLCTQHLWTVFFLCVSADSYWNQSLVQSLVVTQRTAALQQAGRELRPAESWAACCFSWLAGWSGCCRSTGRGSVWFLITSFFHLFLVSIFSLLCLSPSCLGLLSCWVSVHFCAFILWDWPVSFVRFWIIHLYNRMILILLSFVLNKCETLHKLCLSSLHLCPHFSCCGCTIVTLRANICSVLLCVVRLAPAVQ